jgi:hypothetical protein
MCLEMYVWFLGHVTSALSVFGIKEDLASTELYSISGSAGFSWQLVFMTLPFGIHQIQIHGRRPLIGGGGIGVDDVSMLPCDKFREFLYLGFS